MTALKASGSGKSPGKVESGGVENGGDTQVVGSSTVPAPGSAMKVLSCHPAEATLIALRIKPIETRSWQARSLIGQRFAIAATATIPGMCRGDVRTYGGYTVTRDDPYGCEPAYLLRGPIAWPYRLPLGAVVATCTVADMVPVETIEWGRGSPKPGWARVRDVVWVNERERPYGDFTPGRFAWLLGVVVPVNPPVPFKGGQGLTRTWEP